MKILYVTTISNTVNAFLIPHIKMLVENGNQVDVAFNIEKDVKNEIYELGCKIHCLEFVRSPLSSDNIKAYKSLKKIIQDEKYDVVHTHTPIASMVVRMVCRSMNNIKVFYTAHGFHFYKGAPLKNWLIYYPIEKYLSKYTDVLITINSEDYEIAKSKFKAKKVELVNGVGINLKRFQPQTETGKQALRRNYGYKDDDFILIYVGELSYRKNQELVINVVRNLKEKIPNLKVLLVGDGGYKEKYIQQIKILNLEEQVELLGYRKDIDSLMMLADIAISSSRQEGLPVNVMEAMATGLPLVVTNCRGNRDLVENNKNGYVISLDSVNEFTVAVERLFLSNPLRNIFGNKSLENISKYSLDEIIKDMKNIYFRT